MHPTRQPPPIFPACPADSRLPASMDPAEIKRLSPPPHPGWPQPLFLPLSSTIAHHETLLPCILVCTPYALSQSLTKFNSPPFPLLQLHHCAGKTGSALFKSVSGNLKWDQRAACHHTTHSCPVTLPFTSTPTSQLLRPQYPSNSSPSSLLAEDPSNFTENGRDRREPGQAYPYISPPVGTCRHMLCFQLVYFRGNFHHKETDMLYSKEKLPTCALDPTHSAAQGHPTRTSSHFTRLFLSAYRHASIFLLKKNKTHMKTFY